MYYHSNIAVTQSSTQVSLTSLGRGGEGGCMCEWASHFVAWQPIPIPNCFVNTNTPQSKKFEISVYIYLSNYRKLCFIILLSMHKPTATVNTYLLTSGYQSSSVGLGRDRTLAVQHTTHTRTHTHWNSHMPCHGNVGMKVSMHATCVEWGVTLLPVPVFALVCKGVCGQAANSCSLSFLCRAREQGRLQAW